mgnify:CR=1 FL=1
MVAQLLLTVHTGQTLVALLIKPLGMAVIDALPNDQQHQGQPQKTPCIERGDKQQRREHHGVVPVIDAAAAAAFILHKPRLEWTEKENADNVTYREGEGY